jgi:hypothetical protein
MMVGIDEPGDDDVVRPANDFIRSMAGLHDFIRADIFDNPVPLEDSAIGNYIAGLRVRASAGDYIFASDE